MSSVPGLQRRIGPSPPQRVQHANQLVSSRPRLALPMMAVLALASACVAAAPAGAAIAPCSAKNLRLSADGRDGAFNGMSHGGTALSIRNTGPACALPVAPVLTFYDAKGRRLPVRFDQAALSPSAPLVVGGGHRAEAELRWVSGPVYRHSRKIHIAGLGVQAGAALLRVPLTAVMFGEVGQSVRAQQSPMRAAEGMAADL